MLLEMLKKREKAKKDQMHIYSQIFEQLLIEAASKVHYYFIPIILFFSFFVFSFSFLFLSPSSPFSFPPFPFSSVPFRSFPFLFYFLYLYFLCIYFYYLQTEEDAKQPPVKKKKLSAVSPPPLFSSTSPIPPIASPVDHVSKPKPVYVLL